MKFDKDLVGIYYGYRVFKVNEFAIRSSAKKYQEFTNYAISYDFPDLVPKDEVWVSEENDDEELIFIIINAIRQLRLIELGENRDKAYEIGLELEKTLREQLEFLKYDPESWKTYRPKEVYIKPYKNIVTQNGEKIVVWIVDGDKVRNLYKTDFVEGGHGYVYPWVPKDEIWIDDDVKSAEWPFILHHEYVEYGLMKGGMLYEPAHAIAAENEYKMRQSANVAS